jgi:NAD(P)H-dependent FMN reductase
VTSTTRPTRPRSFAHETKDCAAVGHSGGIAGGVRAIEHLAQIAVEAEMMPLRTSTVIPQAFQAFTADRQSLNPAAEISLRLSLDDLKWWPEILEAARDNGRLSPAVFRIQAAAAALNEIEDKAV